MKHKKKFFSVEFKRNEVSLSLNSEKSLGEIAEKLGVGYSTLSKWRNEYGDNTNPMPEAHRKPKEPDIFI